MSCTRNYICPDGCVFEVDATCVIYTGEELTIIGVSPSDNVQEILEALNDISITYAEFFAVSNNTIKAIGGGQRGHAPSYSVRIDPSTNNMITSSSSGLMVNSSQEGDGKVKVSTGDTKNYLENKLGIAADTYNIISVVPTKTSGKMIPVPVLDLDALLDTIESDFLELLCTKMKGCIPGKI